LPFQQGIFHLRGKTCLSLCFAEGISPRNPALTAGFCRQLGGIAVGMNAAELGC
jgi:hypothetical protein